MISTYIIDYDPSGFVNKVEIGLVKDEDLYHQKHLWNTHGLRLSSYHYLNQLEHNDNGPSLVEWGPDSLVCRSEHWFMNGLRHRIGGPAVIERNQYGKITQEWWMRSDILHNDDGPALKVRIERSLSNACWHYEWHHNGTRFRHDGGPSFIDYYDDECERPVFEKWTNKNGEYHRLNGPAIIEYDRYGIIYKERWFVSSKEITQETIKKFFHDNDIDIDNISQKEEALIMLKFG